VNISSQSSALLEKAKSWQLCECLFDMHLLPKYFSVQHRIHFSDSSQWQQPSRTRHVSPIGLNWTVLLKSLEMTLVVIWRYINKTEFIDCGCDTSNALKLNFLVIPLDSVLKHDQSCAYVYTHC